MRTIDEPEWRLTPFEHYPGSQDTFLTVVAGQAHDDMWNNGSVEVERFVAESILQFFEVYVAGVTDADPCTIGDSTTVDVRTERRAGAAASRLDGCR